MSKPDVTSLLRASRLVGHHPAALRSVSWSHQPTANAICHLEIETKHGQVLVFDHQAPIVYCDPPQPTNAGGERLWRDLTEDIPSAFADRPQFAAVHFVLNPARWRFELSTGAHFSFVLDDSTPLLSANPDAGGPD